jgi:hypothetical protein
MRRTARDRPGRLARPVTYSHCYGLTVTVPVMNGWIRQISW